MGGLMGDGESRDGGDRDFPSLYMRLCRCAGPQPSLTNSKADLHAKDCPYRIEVEGDVNSGMRPGGGRCD
jgi:hypothetical protein